VRDHFINNKEARELLALIKKWQAEAKKEKDKELQAAGEAAPKQQQKPKTPKTKQEGKKKNGNKPAEIKVKFENSEEKVERVEDEKHTTEAQVIEENK